MTDALDRAWMEQAPALAALGEGATSPNPRVGCVVVRDGVAVGSGFHPAAGQPHAEVFALAQAQGAARGATLYVNLEPCAHQGRTPPCSDAVIRAGVVRVVASIVDPNPLVDGRGLERIRAAGIDVAVGTLAAEAERLNAPFLSWHRRGRPLVTLKAALTADGMLAAARGRSSWVTAEPARRHAHRQRLRHDAVLVGAGTLRRDDPRLTVRLPGVTASRRRIVLAPSLDLDPAAKLFVPEKGVEPPWVLAAADAPEAPERALAGRARVLRIAREPGGGLDLAAALAALAREGIQAVLVEGGGRTHAAFLRAGLADRVVLYRSPKLFGAGDGATPLLDGFTTSDPNRAWRLLAPRRLPLGADEVVEADLAAAEA